MATAICRRASFPPSLAFACLLGLAPPALAGQVALSFDELRHPAVEADGVAIAFDTRRRGEADIRVARLKVAGVEYHELALHCADFVLDARRLDCPRGEIRRAAARGGAERPPLPFSFSYQFADGRLEFAVAGADAVAVSPLVKRLRAWNPEGRLDLRLAADRRQAKLDVAVRKLRFANKSGELAGEDIALRLEATAERAGQGWRWSASLRWPEGEIYRAPWYRRAGVAAAAQGTLSRETLLVEQARLDLDGIGGVTASLAWDRARGEVRQWGFVTERLDLAAAMREWVQPWLDRSAVPKVDARGHVRFAAEGDEEGLSSFYAGLEDAAIIDGTDTLECRGLEARVPWARGSETEAELSVASARLGELPLGGFRIPVRLAGNGARLLGLSVPLLDGRIFIDQLVLGYGGVGWQGQFSGGVEGLSMPKLSKALKLPIMAGSLTARIPLAAYSNRLLTLDGGLDIRVFDGDVRVSGLKVLEPLSPGQRFVADVTARRLDLGMLTQTFSFGSIQGRFDAEIKGLELAGWKPLRFDARIDSSPGDYPRAISRGALKDISALGGAAGAAAVQASPAGFFSSFDYERIGFGCRLENNVCHFEGIEPAGDGYLMIKGAGIPRVQVIGYNREVDWNLLVSRIQAVIAGRAKAVIE